MSEKKCNTCKHWNTGLYDMGECRKNAPAIVSGMIDKKCLRIELPSAVWPETSEEDWCGEWAKIEPPSVFDKMVQYPPFTDFLDRLASGRSNTVLRKNGVIGWPELFKADFNRFRKCGPSTRRDIARTCYELTKTIPSQLDGYYQPPTQCE